MNKNIFPDSVVTWKLWDLIIAQILCTSATHAQNMKRMKLGSVTSGKDEEGGEFENIWLNLFIFKMGKLRNREAARLYWS